VENGHISMAAPVSNVNVNENTTETPNGFDRFGFHSSILRGVHAAGFQNPRPIQADSIPAALEGRDVLGLAQTGTGKTAAFALPLLDRFARKPGPGPRALVLAPTRELATQIDAEIRLLARFTKLSVETIFGGIPAGKQIRALRKNPEIVVGCPGRVLDLIGRGVLRLGGIETLVLDEADHMFDMGFLPDLKRILKALPTARQNLLFSATMPTEIRSFADALLRDPLTVELTRAGPAETIEHVLVAVAETRKRDLLEYILEQEGCQSAIVFTRTKHRARRLAEQLSRAKFGAVALQGNMSQAQRDRAMEGFRKRRFDVLVATDIAARGIDVQGVSHVINYDVPNTPEAYTHRIGRTGRAELEGQAVTFATREDVSWLRATERKLGAKIPRRTVAGFEGESINSEQPGKSRRPFRPNGGSEGKRSGEGAQKRSGGRSGDKPASNRGRQARRGGSSSRTRSR
jgi:ATP-dependent RNA helicase RhlE